MAFFSVLFGTLVFLLNSMDLVSSHQGGFPAKVQDLGLRIQQLEGALVAYKAELTKPVVRCESGLLVSNYCNPPTQDCFNGKKTAEFSLTFLETPVVTVGFVHLDLDKSENSRVATTDTIQNNRDPDVSGIPYTAYEATETEVSVTFTCWFTSGCHQAAVSWMACGLVSS